MTTTHRYGRRIRRPVLAGSIALLAVLGAGALTVNQAVAGSAGPAAKPDTAPATARSVTAALQAAVADVADGTASGFEGFHDLPGSSQAYDPLDDSPERDTYQGWFTFAPADGSGAALVSAVVRDKEGMDYNQTTAEDNFRTCVPDVEEECVVTTLPDGSLLKAYMSYSMGSDGGNRSHEIVTATRMVGETVVEVSATNGGELTEAGNKVTRPHPALSVEQLTEIVSQPWWGYDLPQEYVAAGADLAGYQETDSNGGTHS